MKKILLTSTGFDNDNIKNKFLSLLNKDINDVIDAYSEFANKTEKIPNNYIIIN